MAKNFSSDSQLKLHNDRYQNNNSKYLVINFFTTLMAVITSLPILIVFGAIADWITVQNHINKPNENIKTGWVLTRVTGWGYTLYPINLFGIFDKNIGSSSKIRSMVYTDYPIRESLINRGGGYDKAQIDLSVLINKDEDFDYSNIYPNSKKNLKKINSQTLQARLIKAHENEEILCIAVTGYRDNKKSEYFNILDIKSIVNKSDNKKNYPKMYDDIMREFKVSDNSKKTSESDSLYNYSNQYSYTDQGVEDAYKKLKELTEEACVIGETLNIYNYALE